MSKKEFKSNASHLLLAAITEKMTVSDEISTEVFVDDAPHDNGFSTYSAFNQNAVNPQDKTSVLLANFLLEAMEFQYEAAMDYLDVIIDLDEETDCFYALLSPKSGLAPHDRSYAGNISRQFLYEIDSMAFEEQYLIANPGINAIMFKNKMTLLSAIISYLNTKDITPIKLHEVVYDSENTNQEIHKKRLDDAVLYADKKIKRDPDYMHKLMLSSPMRPYADKNNFVGSTQNMKDLFTSSAGGEELGEFALSVSNTRTLIAEMIRLENRNNQGLMKIMGEPDYLIN